jgi:hypothetical protein
MKCDSIFLSLEEKIEQSADWRMQGTMTKELKPGKKIASALPRKTTKNSICNGVI